MFCALNTVIKQQDNRHMSDENSNKIARLFLDFPSQKQWWVCWSQHIQCTGFVNTCHMNSHLQVQLSDTVQCSLCSSRCNAQQSTVHYIIAHCKQDEMYTVHVLRFKSRCRHGAVPVFSAPRVQCQQPEDPTKQVWYSTSNVCINDVDL